MLAARTFESPGSNQSTVRQCSGSSGRLVRLSEGNSFRRASSQLHVVTDAHRAIALATLAARSSYQSGASARPRICLGTFVFEFPSNNFEPDAHNVIRCVLFSTQLREKCGARSQTRSLQKTSTGISMRDFTALINCAARLAPAILMLCWATSREAKAFEPDAVIAGEDARICEDSDFRCEPSPRTMEEIAQARAYVVRRRSQAIQ